MKGGNGVKTRRVLKGVAGALVASSLFVSAPVFAAEPVPGVQILKYDRHDAMQLPANFRTAQSDYKKVESGVYPSREGLNELRMSGSSFFSKNEFLEMLKHVPKKDLVVIDLRAESHGYINDNGVSWYSRYKTFNKGQSAQEVDRREKSMLQTALMNGTMDIATLKSDKDIENQVQEKVNSVQTEGEFLKSQGVKYYRVPIMDYSAPTPKNVDDFLAIYKKLPKTAWIHVHCEAGIGRTTMFLTFMDMIKNANKLSYDDIMTREVLLGGQDMRKSAEKAQKGTDEYKKMNYPKRALFTQHIYEYAKENPTLAKSYTQWVKEKGYEF